MLLLLASAVLTASASFAAHPLKQMLQPSLLTITSAALASPASPEDQKMWFNSASNCLEKRGLAFTSDELKKLVYHSGTAGNAVGCRDTTTDVDGCLAAVVEKKVQARTGNKFVELKDLKACDKKTEPAKWKDCWEFQKTEGKTDKDKNEEPHQIYCPPHFTEGKQDSMEVDIWDCSQDDKDFFKDAFNEVRNDASQNIPMAGGLGSAFSCAKQLNIKMGLIDQKGKDGLQVRSLQGETKEQVEKAKNDQYDMICLCKGLQELKLEEVAAKMSSKELETLQKNLGRCPYPNADFKLFNGNMKSQVRTAKCKW